MAMGSTSWSLSGSNDERRDVSRAHVSIEAELRRVGRTPYKVEVRDLSATGCRADTLSKVVVGDRIWLTLPGFSAIEGTIRWATPRDFGVEWARPIHPSIFDFIRQRYPELVC